MLSFNSTKEYLLNLFYPGDKYVVIEILDHYIQVTLFRANLERKRICFIKNLEKTIYDLSILEVLKETGLLLRKVKHLARYRIILSLDSKLATTIYSSVPLVRQMPGEIIDDADMDNLISQAIWRFFDRQRERVAQKMGIDDIDVLLSDVRIRGIKIDGHKVINPIGFKAKFVEFYFSQTFIVRDFIRGLKEILPAEKLVFVTEAGTVLAHAVLNILKPDHLFLANLFSDQTILYTASPGKLRYLDHYEWGQNNLLSHLKNQLRVDSEVARAIIGVYNQNQASPMFLKRFENILIKELQIFLNGLELILDKEQARVYLNPYFELPSIIFSQRCQARLNKSLKISLLSTELISENFGFEISFNKSVKVKNLLTILAAFSEINLLPQDDKLSHLVKRRVRWLA